VELSGVVAVVAVISGKAKKALGDLLKTREREFHTFWKKLRETKRDGTLHIAPRRSGAA